MCVRVCVCMHIQAYKYIISTKCTADKKIVHMCSGKGKRRASSSGSGTLQTPARFTGGGGSISSRSKTPGTFKTPHTPATRKTPKTPFTSASMTPALDNACSVIVGMAD